MSIEILLILFASLSKEKSIWARAARVGARRGSDVAELACTVASSYEGHKVLCDHMGSLIFEYS